MKCNKCGANVSENALFCNNCGSKISRENIGKNAIDFEVQKHCMTCGAVLNPGSSFCSECGTSLKTEPIRRTRSKKTKKNNTVIVLTIILLVLIIALGCFIRWIVFGNNSNEQHTEDFVMPDVQNVIDEDAYRKDTENDEQSDKTDEGKEQEEETTEEEEDISEENNAEFLFPTHERYITERDLEGLDKDEVALIRNEIYARHGFVFKTEPYKSYFADKDWYEPNEEFSESMFNSYEKENKSFIVEYEKKMGWR